MPIYQAVDQFTVGLGKDIPAMGPFKGKPINIRGPHSGKIQAGVYVASKVYNYFRKYPKFAGSATGIAISAGLGINAPRSKYGEALRSAKFSSSRRRRYNANKHRVCCCCTPKFRKRSKRRF